MTGKVLENKAAGVLVLILPIALTLVVVFTAWPLLLLLLAISIGWRLWDNYQWQQWCQRVNPSFIQLIKDNKGALTVMDLSLKANLTGRSAQRFLDRKAEEYGAQRKDYREKGSVYYFLTVSALGTIFDDSDVFSEAEDEEETVPAPPQNAAQLSQSQKPSFSAIAQLASKQAETTAVESASAEEETDAIEEVTQSQEGEGLNQADLAKRLDLNPSTIARRKSTPSFSEWSQSKDPEGIAWQYVSETQMFLPVKD